MNILKLDIYGVIKELLNISCLSRIDGVSYDVRIKVYEGLSTPLKPKEHIRLVVSEKISQETK